MKILLVFLALATACAPTPVPAPMPSCSAPARAWLAGTVPAALPTPTLVPLACCHLRALSCPMAAPTPAGATCEEWLTARACAPGQAGCVDAQCVAQATSCAAADRCGK